jgi:Family of unknown function (DUF5681)
MVAQTLRPTQGESSMNDTRSKTAVGYKKPPTEHQFVPGTSGNPLGRPKGRRSFMTELREELSRFVTICEDGGQVIVTKHRALLIRLLDSALKGDARALSTALSLSERAFGNDEDSEGIETPEDQEIMKAVTGRKGGRQLETDDKGE